MDARKKNDEDLPSEIAVLGVKPDFEFALENFNRDIEERLRTKTREGINAEYLAAGLNVFRKLYAEEVKEFFEESDYEEKCLNIRVEAQRFQDQIMSFEHKPLNYIHITMKSGDQFIVKGYHMRDLVERHFDIKRVEPGFFLMLCRVVIEHYEDMQLLGIREKIAEQVF